MPHISKPWDPDRKVVAYPHGHGQHISSLVFSSNCSSCSRECGLGQTPHCSQLWGDMAAAGLWSLLGGRVGAHMWASLMAAVHLVLWSHIYCAFVNPYSSRNIQGKYCNLKNRKVLVSPLTSHYSQSKAGASQWWLVTRECKSNKPFSLSSWNIAYWYHEWQTQEHTPALTLIPVFFCYNVSAVAFLLFRLF